MMISIGINQTKQWLKQSQHPVALGLYLQLKKIRKWSLPAPRVIFTPLYFFYCSVSIIATSLSRVFFWTPLLKGKLDSVGSNLYLYGGLPFISGSLKIVFGDDCRVSGHTTFSGRTSSKNTPQLIVGNNVDISYMTNIAVGQRVVIGNNVRIAERCLLSGYPGHPLDANDRAIGLPETDNQVADIILEDDVWLAAGVSVLAGVTIGQGTVVATGSVVTHDLPAMVLAGGIPAKVIRHLDQSTNNKVKQAAPVKQGDNNHDA